MQKLSSLDRKADARKKIMLGGLIIKAELDHLQLTDSRILYGMLLECKKRLNENPNITEQWRENGNGLLSTKVELG